jgi:hypothetical protein
MWGNVYVQQANSVLAGRAQAASHTATNSPSAAGADEGLGSAAAARDIPGPAVEDVGANFFGVSRFASHASYTSHTSNSFRVSNY